MSTALQSALEVFLVGLVTIIGKFIIDWINIKREEVKQRTENEIAAKYTDMIATTIANCVIATNQTYVNALKDRDAFDKDAQLNAFNLTLDAVLAILNEDTLAYLDEFTSDTQTYLITLIEAEVAKQKQEKGSN